MAAKISIEYEDENTISQVGSQKNSRHIMMWFLCNLMRQLYLLSVKIYLQLKRTCLAYKL